MQGLIVSLLEVLAICTLLFLVLSEFSPGVSILLFSSIFVSQTIINVFDSNACTHRSNYKQAFTKESNLKRTGSGFTSFIGISTKVIAFLLQVVAILGIMSYFAYKKVVLGEPLEYRIVVGMPLAILVLSILWSNRCQEFIARSPVCGVSARYKSGMLLVLRLGGSQLNSSHHVMYGTT